MERNAESSGMLAAVPKNPADEECVTDDEVLRRIRGGETGLYEILARRYDGRIRRMTSRLLSSDAEVDDVVQEAHLRAFSHLDHFKGLSSFPTWITRIAINQTLTYLRSRSRFEQIGSHTDYNDQKERVFRSTLRGPEQHTSNEELRRDLKAALQQLPAPYRVVFVLREIEQLSTSEVVKRLGISEACAKSRLHRAGKQLRQSLCAWAGGERRDEGTRYKRRIQRKKNHHVRVSAASST